MKKHLVLFSLILLMVGTSCVHHSPYKDEYWFQALGEEGEYVASVDLERLIEGEGDSLIDRRFLDNPVVNRGERLSLSLFPKTEDYVASLDSYIISGALEGNYPKGLSNAALKHEGYSVVKEDGITYYSDNGLNAYSPKNGIVIFTSSDYEDFFDKTIENREKRISDEEAYQMASSLMSLYVFEPKTLLDIGFEIPETVLAEMTKTLLMFNSRDNELLLSGRIEATEDGSARALTTLLKNQVIQNVRRSGEKLDIKLLSSCFSTEENVVTIIDLPLSGSFLEKARKIINEGFGGIL